MFLPTNMAVVKSLHGNVNGLFLVSFAAVISFGPSSSRALGRELRPKLITAAKETSLFQHQWFYWHLLTSHKIGHQKFILGVNMAEKTFPEY